MSGLWLGTNAVSDNHFFGHVGHSFTLGGFPVAEHPFSPWLNSNNFMCYYFISLKFNCFVSFTEILRFVCTLMESCCITFDANENVEKF